MSGNSESAPLYGKSGSAYYDPNYGGNVYPSVPSAPQQQQAPQQVAPQQKQYVAPPQQTASYIPLSAPHYVYPAPAPVPQHTCKKSSCCGSCCLFLFSTVALILSIAAISLSGVSFSGIYNTSPAVQRFYAVQDTPALHHQGNQQLSGYSILSNGNVAVGHGYRLNLKGQIPYYSAIGFPADQTFMSNIDLPSSHYALIARSYKNSLNKLDIVVTAVSAKKDYFYRGQETTYSPKNAMKKLIGLINSKVEQNSVQAKMVCVFESTSGQIYGIAITATNNGYLTFDSQEFLIYNTKYSYVSGISSLALTDNKIVINVALGNSPNNYITYCTLSSTASCQTDATSKSCVNIQSFISINSTSFFTLCDTSMYYWTVQKYTTPSIFLSYSQSIKLFPTSLYTSLATGPFAARIDNSTIIAYYTDKQKNLKAVLGTVKLNRWGSFEITGTQKEVLIDTAINMQQPIRLTTAGVFMNFFVYATGSNAFIAKPFSLVKNEVYGNIRLAKQNIILNSTGALPVTPLVSYFAPSTDNRENAGIFSFAPLGEWQPPQYTPNEYRYYQIFGGMEVIGVSDGSSCNYFNYDGSNCNANLVTSGILSSYNTDSERGLYVGAEYFVNNEGVVTTEETSLVMDEQVHNKKIGVAITDRDLLLKIY